jgi:hypothetical protein
MRKFEHKGFHNDLYFTNSEGVDPTSYSTPYIQVLSCLLFGDLDEFIQRLRHVVQMLPHQLL